ncbi:MAG TPA: PleD family two-component system response regulator [Hyphomicrobiaceae bacterium]|nr:PleD family two-component system response regulator [Hyphomicrobiaceae bacterium]
MTAKVLVVDDILANVKLLEARLQAEYFEVLPAYNGEEALEICARERIDVVLLDVMMPGMDGFEVCKRIKSNPATQDLPVIMVTALDQPSDKLQGLDAGADDFLTKPVDDIALITRVKNLARLKTLNDEMAMRASTSCQLGLPGGNTARGLQQVESGRVLLVDDHARSAGRTLEALAKSHEAEVQPDMQAALAQLTDQNFDLLLVSLSLSNADGLRLCSQVRSLDKIRHLPIIILVEPGDEARLLRGLDMGVNDYLMRPIDRNEMLARVKTQIKRKRYSDFLRNRLEESVEAALTDSLTGLHNRRYMETHLRALVDESTEGGRSLSILVADIDHFKRINDTYGHDVGDKVLREFGKRLRDNIRVQDLACRMGGEEFVIIMPDTTMADGFQIAERIRSKIAEEPFYVSPDCPIVTTASVGMATIETTSDTVDTLFKRADNALYAAKREGRNRVVSIAA